MKTDVKIDMDEYSSNDELNFQDISPSEKTQSTQDVEGEADHDTAELLGRRKGTPAFWSMQYYQQFFDVDTSQVLSRLLGSVIPNPRKNFLQAYIRPTPDLYGPFWICVTLVFANAIAGNMAQYLTSKGTSEWVYDFHKVTLAATVVFSYWWVVPSLIYAVLWWRGARSSLTYLELLCLYGYSLAVYVPLAILLTIPATWMQWLFVALGGVLSGSVLVITLWPVFKQDNNKVAAGLSSLVFVLHLLLAVVFMMYFFHYPTTVNAHLSPDHTLEPSFNVKVPKSPSPDIHKVVGRLKGGSEIATKNKPAVEKAVSADSRIARAEENKSKTSLDSMKNKSAIKKLKSAVDAQPSVVSAKSKNSKLVKATSLAPKDRKMKMSKQAKKPA